MKHNKNQEAEALRAYEVYFDSYVNGDVKKIASLLDNDYNQIGSAESEVFYNKKDAMKFIDETIDQVAGKTEIRNRNLKADALDGFILITDLFDIYVLIDSDWSFYSKFRASTLMQKKEDGWKFIHQHSSMPDTRTQEGENIAIEQISAENLQLREAVKRRTIELEQKKRDLEIEATLEKVRSRSLAMHHSHELQEVVNTVFEQMKSLDLSMNVTSIFVFHPGVKDWEQWVATSETNYSELFRIPYVDLPVFRDLETAKKKNKDFYSVRYSREQKNEWFDYAFNHTDYRKIPAKRRKYLLHSDFFEVSFALSKHIGIQIAKYEGSEFTEEENKILKRFTVVFEQTYTRFRDLQKAEAQAREAQIEAALERVRSKTMAMHNSQDVGDTVATLFDELVKLGVQSNRCGIVIFNDSPFSEIWTVKSIPNEKATLIVGNLDTTIHPLLTNVRLSWENKQSFFSYEMEGDYLKEYYSAINKYRDYPTSFNMESLPSRETLSDFFFSEGALFAFTNELLSQESTLILKRFAGIFGQTYRRYLDLIRAEAQARESQIEAALERVRSRSMAMHHSNEINDVATVMFNQIRQLGGNLWTCGITLCENNSKEDEFRVALERGLQPTILIPNDVDEVHKKMYKGWKSRSELFTIAKSGKELEVHYKYMRSVPSMRKAIDDMIASGLTLPTWQKWHAAYFAHGYLLVITLEPYPEEQIFIRFANVFEQAYTRFLDLQKAEAQAREAEIELGLERVRAKAMGMHSSKELNQLIGLFFTELTRLELILTRCAFYLLEPDCKSSRWWLANSEAPSEPMNFLIPYHEHPPHLAWLNAVQAREQKWEYKLQGKIKQEWDAFLFSKTELAQLPKGIIEAMKAPKLVILTGSFNRFGSITLATLEPLTEGQVDILIRFAKVFEQTYTRFLDLQKAEAQAREAQIEAALERVRASAMAMHSSEELKDVAKELRKQIASLGQKELDTCVIQLYDESPTLIHSWAAMTPSEKNNEDREFYGAIPKKGLLIQEEALQCYASGRKDYVLLNEKQKLKQWMGFMKKTYPVVYKVFVEFLDGLKPENTPTYWSFSDFKGGSLLMVTVAPPVESSRTLLKKFASVFGLAYRRFVDLKQAEAQAREAQIQLALERVRAGTMAMHKSEELSDTASIMFQELKKLGINSIRTGVCIFDFNHNSAELWLATEDGDKTETKVLGKVYGDMHPMYQQWIDAGAKRKKMFQYKLSGKEVSRYYDVASDQLNLPRQTVYNKNEFYTGFLFPEGSINVISLHPLTEEECDIGNRFANVFGLLYRRFLDLQKAEAQAREAQIEIALERVRAKAMAMHTSSDLKDVALEIRRQIGNLGMKELETCAIHLYEGTDEYFTSWAALQSPESEADIVLIETLLPRKGVKNLERIIDSYNKKKLDYLIANDWTSSQEFSQALKLHAPEAYKVVQKTVRNKKKNEIQSYWAISDFKGGSLLTSSLSMPEEASQKLLRRFANVFDLAYRRFSDLQKAEAQAREAQIEAALEKVRSRSLAMHKAEELGEVATVVFEKLRELDMPVSDGVAIVTQIEGSKDQIEWMESPDHPAALKVYQPYYDHPILADYWKAKNEGLDFIAPKYTAEQSRSFFNHIFEFTDYKHTPQEIKDYCLAAESYSYFAAFQKNSSIFINDFSGRSLSTKEIEIVKRFSKVFEQAYVRFLDLQKAEAQAREAQIEAALERVRSRTMGMQRSEELQDAAMVLLQQVIGLGVPAFGSGFNIWDDDQKFATAWMGGQDRLQPPFKTSSSEDVFRRIHKAAQSGESLFVEEQGGEALKRHYEYMNSIPVFKEIADKMATVGQTFPSFQIVHCAFFSQGYLMFITFEPVPEAYDIFKRFAKVFEQTYTRFIDLKKAEAQVREAQIEAALERVRSRSIAMRKSEEIAEIAGKIFSELRQLDLVLNRVLIWTFNDTEKYTTWWSANPEVESTAEPYRIDYNENPVFLNYLMAWRQRKPIHLYTLAGDNKKSWEDHLFEHTEMSRLPMEVRKGMRAEGTLYTVSVVSDYGLMMSGSFEPLSDASVDIIQRFGRVFQQSYTRYLDVQKAEAQAREAEIQLALERVRARSMAMHKSEELTDTAKLLYQELSNLGIPPFMAGFVLVDEKNSNQEVWISSPEGEGMQRFFLPLKGDKVLNERYRNWKKKIPVFYKKIEGEELARHLEYVSKFYGTQEAVEVGENFPDAMAFYCGYFPEGYLHILSENILSPSQESVMLRFTQTFAMVYRRFLDLQKVEAQAREAEIQLALERVRAQTMAMHNSNDMGNCILKMFDELTALGVDESTRFGIGILNHDNENNQLWTARKEGEEVKMHIGNLDMTLHPLLKSARKAWIEQVNLHEYVLEGDDLLKYYQMINNARDYKLRVLTEKLPEREFHYGFIFSHGFFYAFSPTEFQPDLIHIAQRFSALFEQTYTRFLDLQKAEAQAREAQIETALERIRSRTMAMHKSDELADVASLLFQQIGELGIRVWTAGFNVWQNNDTAYQDWITSPKGGFIEPYLVDTTQFPVFIEVREAKQRGDEFFVQYVSGEMIKAMYQELSKFAPQQFEIMLRDGFEFPKHQYDHFVFGASVSLMFITFEPLPEAHEIFKRFGKVFEQTYTRFLDLKKAEAQAREAQIEAALERVRARAMAMQKSDELCEVVGLVSEELNISLENTICIIMNFDWKSKEIEWWSTGFNVDNLPESYKIPIRDTIKDHPLIRHYREAVQKGISYKVYKLEGEIKRSWDNYIFEQSDLKKIPLETQNWMRSYEGVICNEAFMSHGVLEVDGPEQLSDEKAEVLQRFAKVVDLTYKRIEDLQQAEARTVEAVRQASLDRVRGEIASMRTTGDLERITPLIWRELTTLNISFIRCGVFIMDEERGIIHNYLSNPEGKAIAAFHLPYSTPGAMKNILQHWHERKIFLDHWDDAAMKEFADILVAQRIFTSQDQYLNALPKGGFYLHFLPFNQGMLYVGSTTQLNDGAVYVIQSLADAFSTAYARYEDFNKLEAAKKQVDNALVELKQAQQQLIQSEKMASLGELTAGIAHEIQNPLNFVNNFSEVSTELVDEMNEELEGGNIDEVKAITIDLKQNLEKINHHGKRASSIVKGMLEHSRTGTREKQLTDINAMADEYLRLAYHGLRAKDKSFSAEFKLDLDASLPKVNVIGQDIGRVLLNLINNAFYAVSEKSKKGISGYQPIVIVKTRKKDKLLEIRVTDNADGIPSSIINKIFQPFFTTKPTGSGTGLGLSLSYDIITMGHNGTLEVDTTEGLGTEFIIQLPLA